MVFWYIHTFSLSYKENDQSYQPKILEIFNLFKEIIDLLLNISGDHKLHKHRTVNLHEYKTTDL